MGDSACWPNDADGDVLRSMRSAGFDFRRPCLIDFNVDFEDWPPPEAALGALKASYPNTRIYEPTDADTGYVQFQLFDVLSYELVIRVQKHVTELVEPYGGACESWGVLH